jgi:hypothetical protein
VPFMSSLIATGLPAVGRPSPEAYSYRKRDDAWVGSDYVNRNVSALGQGHAWKFQ